jgi:hypothetical protein
MKRFAILTLLAGLVALPLFAQMNPTGTLTGHVTDGKVALPGVTVSATSPNLQGTRTAVTAVTGDYILTFLPAGEYNVRFELAGFQSLDTTIKISAAQISRLDATMPETKVAEVVTVTGTYETISSSQQVASTMDQNLLNSLPTGRTPVTAASLAPGVTVTGPNNALVISGAQSYENLYLVNGVAIMDNIRNTPHALYIEDAVQETTTQTAAISAEYGRFAGGVVNTLTKSGGNELHGTFRDSLSNDMWTAPTPVTVSRSDTVNSIYEATLGGWILKDRLWYFLGGRSRKTTTTGQTYSTNISFPQTDDEKRYEGKLTFSLTPNHRIIGSYLKIDRTQTNNVFGTILDLASLDAQRELPTDLLAFNYTGVLSDTIFVEAQYSKKTMSFVGSGGDATDLINGTVIRDNVHYWRSNSPAFCGVCGPERRDNEDWLVKGSWFLSSQSLGSHDIVLGYDSFNDIRKANNYQSGSNWIYWPTEYLTDASGKFVLDPTLNQPIPVLYGDGSSDFTLWAMLAQSLGTQFRTNSVYINDRWRLNGHFSFNIGIRYDKNDGEDASHNKVITGSRVSPRLGISYDLNGDGNWLFNASYGYYVTAVANSIADKGAGNPSSFGYLYLSDDLNTPDTCTAENPGACLNAHQVLEKVFAWLLANGTDAAGRPLGREIAYGGIAGLSDIVAPGLQSPYAEEYQVGFSKRLGSRGLVRMDYVNRQYKDLYAVKTDATTGQVTDSLGVTSDIALTINDKSTYTKKYDGVTVQASYRVSDGLNVGGNYTWSHAYGNYIGETAGSGPVEAGSPYYYYPEYVQAKWNLSEGDLPTDQRHTGRVYLVWDLLNTRHHLLSVSFMESYFSGTPYGANGNIYSYPYVTDAPDYATPPVTVGYWFTPRDAFHTDNITRTDIGFNYSFRFPALGSDIELFIHPYVTNVLNEQGAVYEDQTVYTRYSGSSWPLFNPFTTTPKECPQGTARADCKTMKANWQKGPNFGKPVGTADYQTPRTFSVSFGVRF